MESESNKILLHQGFYGEVNKAHSCVKQTLVDSKVSSFLTSFTDRPAALPIGKKMLPYLSGGYYSGYYFFCKTFSDEAATRSGMVFSHVLIIDYSDIAQIHNIAYIFSHFISSLNDKDIELNIFEIQHFAVESVLYQIEQPKYIQQVISAYLDKVKPILFSGDESAFIRSLQIIWNDPDSSKRKLIKFRSSFTPADLSDDQTIVTVQADFFTKWHGHDIIKAIDNDSIVTLSPVEAMFIGFQTSENAFYFFLKELTGDVTQITDFRSYGKLFHTHNQISSIADSDLLRSQLRLLAIFSPYPNKGETEKRAFLDRFVELFESGSDKNIKALRNIDWNAFVGGVEIMEQLIQKRIKQVLYSQDIYFLEAIADLINICVSESEKNWWHAKVSSSIKEGFRSGEREITYKFWLLVNFSDELLYSTFSLLSEVDNCEDILISALPVQLKETTYEPLFSCIIGKKWLLLYAHLLTTRYSFEESIIKQLAVEKNVSLNDSAGLKFLVAQNTNDKLIQAALTTKDKKLIDLSILSIEKDEQLLERYDPSNNTWFEIWYSLAQTKSLYYGITNKEKETVFVLLDKLLNGREINSTILNRISSSNFANISEYENRKLVWVKLPRDSKGGFLDATAHLLLTQVLEGRIGFSNIEGEVLSFITTNKFLTKFLSEHRNNIEPVLKIYEYFKKLPDGFLADYIKNYRFNITEHQSMRLGSLILDYQFQHSARQTTERAKYLNSFDIASGICKSIVPYKFGDLFSSFFNSNNDNKTNMIPVVEREDFIPIVVILTALKEEYNAVKEHLTDLVTTNRSGTSYESGIFQYDDMSIANVIIRECGATNTVASQEAERAFILFEPNAMFFVGIAGSLKPNNFAVGDVIFPEKVYSYEGGKSESNSFKARPDNSVMSYSLKETAKGVRRDNEWQSLIKGAWDKDVKADLGVIASGEQLVEHVESSVGKILNQYYNDTAAVEMEGFGFGKALNRQGSNSTMLVGVVRGISDIVGQSNRSEEGQSLDRRPDNAKQFASATAAAFTYWLILKTYS